MTNEGSKRDGLLFLCRFGSYLLQIDGSCLHLTASICIIWIEVMTCVIKFWIKKDVTTTVDQEEDVGKITKS